MQNWVECKDSIIYLRLDISDIFCHHGHMNAGLATINSWNKNSEVVSFSNDTVAVLTEEDHELMNLTQLSKVLKVSYDFIKDMRTMGFTLPIGGMTTLSFALGWLNQNPNFREDARILKLSRRPRPRVHPQRPTAGRSYEPRLKNGSRSSARHSLACQHELAA